MDTIMSSLPPPVGAFLMDNFAVIEIVSMFSIGAYNALETGITTFDVFRRYRGLYFWSMQAASWGILLHALPAMARLVSRGPNLPLSVLFMIGWCAMVTGQAMVLYSRLYLVVVDIRRFRWVAWMIALNSLVFCIPMTALFLSLQKGNAHLARVAVVYDRIQLASFCIQDMILCGIYLYEAVRVFTHLVQTRGSEGRKVITHLICVNVFVVLMNVLLLVSEYRMHYIQVSFKTVVYSIKLKLEFSVLNRLRFTMSSPIQASLACSAGTGEPREIRRSTTQEPRRASLPGYHQAVHKTISESVTSSEEGLSPGTISITPFQSSTALRSNLPEHSV